MRSTLLAILAGITMLAPSPTSADVVFAGAKDISGFGFGNYPRALTIQSHGPSNNSESGCIAPNGSGGLTAGASACAPSDGVVGGDEQNPIKFPKQAAPTLSSLGITSGSQVGILFDAVQPQNSNNNVVTIDDLTLKVYDGTKLVFTASGSFSDLLTNPGNGKSDYLFTLDSAEAAAFDAAVAGNFSDTIALDSTISFPRQSAGPDSYTLVSTLASSTVPEPATLLMFGGGLLVLGVFGRKRIKAA